MRVCLIFNPNAAATERIKDFLLHISGEHRCELRPATAAGDCKRFAREAIAENYDRIVVAGGDGTLSQVVNGIAPDFAAIDLAVLPIGTGNDLARSLGLSPDRIDLAARAAFGEHLAPIDLLRIRGIESTYCVNVANGGFGGLVAADVHAQDKQRWGPMAYWMTSVSLLTDLQPFEVSLSLDGKRVETSTYGVAVANGRFVGGGFTIAPRARLDDGLIDVTTIPVLPMLEQMAAGFNFVLGREHHDERVVTYQVHELQIHSVPAMPFSIDGEPQRTFDASFDIVPRAIRFAIGEHPVGLNGTGPPP